MTMSNGVTGGVFASVSDLQSSAARLNTRVELNNGNRYVIEPSLKTDGITLNNGLFANPINGLHGTFTIDIVSGESSRTSDVDYYTDFGPQAVPVGNIDRVYHVEGNVPTDPSITTQRELIAYSFTLETDHHEPNGGDIRGVKGIVKGNGGQANLRSAHFITQGYNGHTGDVTGVLADVFYSDKATGVNDPTGKSACFIGQVGPGMVEVFTCRSALRAGGQPERPNYGFRVQEGVIAVRPEIACFQGHGGGNGAILRGLYSDVDTREMCSISNKGVSKMVGHYTGSESINDDSVGTVIIPNNATGFIDVITEGSTTQHGRAFFRASSSSAIKQYGGAAFDVGSGVPNGTTGTDGNVTLFVDSAGNLYIENRSSVTRQITWHITGR